MTLRRSGVISLLLLPAALGCSDPPEVPVEPESRAPDNRAVLASEAVAADSQAQGLGEGFLVWESNRTGRWRLWIRDLAGGEPRQLTPDEGRNLHCCPHISPDGEQIAYLSLPPDQNLYPEGGALGSMFLIRPEGSDRRQLLPAARNYYENRAAVWRSPDELIFIDPEGYTALHHLDTGETERLTSRTAEGLPWLIDSQLAWAASGDGAFSPYDRRRRRVAPRGLLRGCQPYFSHDGLWGFWVVAPGGPIDRIRLDTAETATMLRKSDPSLPSDYGYLYFPMLSRDGRLFAFAASPDDQDHFKADYEVFVAETDPRTLEILHPPVRFTHHPATDRFPDVFLAPLPLGRQFGEAPFRWTARPDGPQRDWQWSYGDGATSRGPLGEHVFARAGRFEVLATAGQQQLRGQVAVAAARPPVPLAVSLLARGRELVVAFDEPIQITRLEATLESGHRIDDYLLDHEDRRLRLQLAEPLTRADRLHLAGITDRAQHPNSMAPAVLAVEPPLWPASREGLIFLWQTGDAPNLVFDPALGAEAATILSPRGAARLDPFFAMDPHGGSFVPTEETSRRVFAQIKSTYELSLESVIEPDSSLGERTGVVLAMANKWRMNFSLEQVGRTLLFGIRMRHRGDDAYPRIALFELPDGERSHVAVTYSPGRLTAYRDGKRLLEEDSVRDGFFPWREASLVIGRDGTERSPWRGRLEGVAIYNRVLSEAQIEESYLRYRAILEARPLVDRWSVRAAQTSCSAVPSLAEISPYREALSLCEYRIDEVLEGDALGSTVRVAHWSILDGRPLSLEADNPQPTRLVLTLLSDNPQLESVYLSDTLAAAPGLPVFYLESP